CSWDSGDLCTLRPAQRHEWQHGERQVITLGTAGISPGTLGVPREMLRGAGLDADTRGSQRAAALGVLFALIMLLIIYSSGSGSEVFPYSRLRGRARRPPNLKKWGVKSGYLPVCGNK
ncbi:PREDICTED: alpha-N-acetylgalactosaminide alpha-2,6-sialyltransferase 6-like, partial [Buceros rhinoceros silvestris]|uniref:alpha-N-acetylgalactosaminide alpha-2,6-sialyltransferase 6-like n=1 Tax=Buceros rhinoceros silvestris TaxID=175836 RepID=UPI00052882D0